MDVPTTEPFPAGISLADHFVSQLPGDHSGDRNSRAVVGACYSLVSPIPVSAPRLIAHAPEVAQMLALDEAACGQSAFAEVFAGNRLLPGSRPYAACYGGHQFGNWAGQLGDGRAITLGERLTAEGQRFELQLKGAGPTPYSRGADGRAVMRSSVREFLCSEAMHHLGVPTTRALSLVATGDAVTRDMLYDGNPKDEPGAIVCRVAPSFLRFGNYQLFSSRNDAALLRALLDYTIRTHFPELGEPSRPAYLSWFETVCQRTVDLVVHWQRVGFVHGVMNTDNMSVLGLTIDYGPYGWLEPFEPDWTPNTTDAQGRRYRYGHQPAVAMWNLVRLAEAILPLIEMPGPLEDILRASSERLESGLHAMWLSKLGLQPSEHSRADDEDLIESLQSLLQQTETDMTLWFRGLADVDLARATASADDASSFRQAIAPLLPAYYDDASCGEPGSALQRRTIAWLVMYRERLATESVSDTDRRARMNRVNPKYVLRNYLAQLAIDEAEQGDGSLVMELLEVLRRPYDEQPKHAERYAARRPEWARHRVGCSMLSCSS